jgi:lipopolysaccharide export system permease protein
MTLAVGMSLGSSLAMSRIARESELTAIRATGVRILRTIAPFMVFGVFVALANFYVAEHIMPPMTKRANQILFQIGALGGTPDLKPNVVVTLEQFTAVFGVVHKVGLDELDLDDAWLFDHPAQGQENVYYAKSGHYKAGIWTFRNAYLRRFDGLNVTPIQAAKMTINQRIITDSLFSPPTGEELTARELLDRIDLAKKNHFDYKSYEVKYQVRYSVPCACIIFALVGPVFAIIFARSGGFMGVLLSIVMVLLYYNAFVISTEILSKVDFVSGWFAAWLPNMIFALIGVIAIRRLE